MLKDSFVDCKGAPFTPQWQQRSKAKTSSWVFNQKLGIILFVIPELSARNKIASPLKSCTCQLHVKVVMFTHYSKSSLSLVVHLLIRQSSAVKLAMAQS